MNILENLSKIKIFNKIGLLQSEIDELRPISKEQEQRIFQKYKLDWNYHSNAIEGNSLNYGETVAFIKHGLTAKGKPLKDHLDIKGHNEAINFILSIVKEPNRFTENDIRALHELILVEPYESPAKTAEGLPTKKLIKIGTYKTSPNSVETITGEMHYYATVEDTPILMRELMEWLKNNFENKKIHPIVLAAIFHHKFVSIHPFDDGNGRIARLIMNLILMQKDYPPVVIKKDDENKNAYYFALSQADTGNYMPFVEFIAENMINSLEIYLKGAKGESLDEPDDFEKEMALFKMELKGQKDYKKEIKTKENVNLIMEKSINPLLKNIDLKFNKLKELFFDYKISFIKINERQRSLSKIYDNINEIIELFKSSIDLKNNIIICFQFEELRNSNNPFGIEFNFQINFKKYEYEISYNISEINELINKIFKQNEKSFLLQYKNIVKNYYTQNLEKEEIVELSNKIALDCLNLTKERYNKK